MNQVTVSINRGIRGPFKLHKLDRNDPVEARMYDNRRLELIAEFQPKSIKIRRKSQ